MRTRQTRAAGVWRANICVRIQDRDMGSEDYLKMELCSGKGSEMLYFTNEIMKQSGRNTGNCTNSSRITIVS